MADKKKTETKDTQDTASQIAELELRIAKLEAKQAGSQVFGDLFKDGAPTQDDVRDWVKANPFVAMGITFMVALLMTLIF